MNIVLIGFRCSGKTTIGKIIATKLAMEFLDTDDVIEHRTGMTIEALVEKEGWEYFRKIEKRIVAELAHQDSIVLATGGGVPLDMDNLKILKSNGWIVWLKASTSVVKQRMREQLQRGILRPSLRGADSIAEVDSLLQERDPLYQQAAQFIIETDNVSPEEAAKSIITAYNALLGIP